MVIGDIILNEVNTLDAQQLLGTLTVGTVNLGIDLNLDAHTLPFREEILLGIKIPQNRRDASGWKGNAVNFNFSKGLCGVVLVLIIAACGTFAQAPPDKADEDSRKDFMSAMRWKQYPVAASLMKPEYRKDFLATFNNLKTLDIVDVRLIDLQTSMEGRRFETTIEMYYYILPSITVKTFRLEQTWVLFDGEDPALQGFLIVTPFPEFP